MSSHEKIGLPEPGDRVLWVRHVLFGDVLQAAGDACNFKRRFPDIHLTFLSHPAYSDFLKCQPYIDDAIGGCKKPFTNFCKTLKTIRAGHYKWIVSDQGGGKSSLLSLFSGAEHRIGRCSLFFFRFNYHISPEAYFEKCGVDVKDRSTPTIFVSQEEKEEARAMLSSLPERKLFCVIGSTEERKMWPADGWIEFLRPLAKQGWGIVLNGYGPIEKNMGDAIERAVDSPNVLNLVGALKYNKMAWVATQCSMAIGNDTGPLHLAALAGVPALGLFNFPPADSAVEMMRAPWTRKLCASDHVAAGKNEYPLKKLPACHVERAFGEFTNELLPDAHGRRGENLPREATPRSAAQ
jgi:ADP-heptose:LPS heptosyltransferase